MELDIYTDCGGSVSEYGVGIHIIDQNENEESYLLKTHIDLINEEYGMNVPGSTSIGEIYAILTALKLVKSDVKKVTIYTDNLHSFNVLNKIELSKPHKEHLKLLQNVFDSFLNKFDIDLRWIKGHVGVYGNEIVDSITQKALKKSVKKNKLSKIGIPAKGKGVKYI